MHASKEKPKERIPFFGLRRTSIFTIIKWTSGALFIKGSSKYESGQSMYLWSYVDIAKKRKTYEINLTEN